MNSSKLYLKHDKNCLENRRKVLYFDDEQLHEPWKLEPETCMDHEVYFSQGAL